MRERLAWLAVLAGALLFLGVTRGGAVLDPRNTDWLLLRADTATGYLGWQFFRQAPLLQFPFGANRDYGMEMGMSVVFTDSVPLLALLLKPLSSLLPPDFQYFGAWLLACFVLQALFAYKLMRQFSPNPWLAFLGSLFFALAPAWLARLEGHFALAGQWTLLAALYLYFAPRFSAARWTALLAVAALVHFYLLVMVGFVWAADLWQRRWRHETTALQAAAAFVLGAGATLAVMACAGYFMIGNAAGDRGFGHFRMNLLSLVDPNELWSQLLPDLPGSGGEVEGFNYLGLGILALAALALFGLLQRPQRITLDPRTLVPLLCVSLALTLLALSNQISLGTREVLVYDIPAMLQPYADMLRSSGRMFWPVYYALYVAVLALAFRALAAPTALALCVALLAAQVADSAAGLGRFAQRFVDAPAWSSPFRSALWQPIGARYHKVLHVLPRNAADRFVPLALFAQQHGMAVNFGYFARVNAERLFAARGRLEAEVLDNRLDADGVYVFENRALWRMALAQAHPADVVGLLDGFRIIAPRLKECAACDLRALGDVRPERLGVYPLGERVSFAKGGASEEYAVSGWSPTEEWGTWSQAPLAWLAFDLGEPPSRDLVLSLEAQAFVPRRHPRQEIEISVNGAALRTLVYTAPLTPEIRAVRIPQALAARGNGRVLVQLRMKDARSPSELGLGEDRRPLGLGLIAVTLSGV